ncbi:C39 family peptidase [Methylocystis sp. H62]|uniref:C39 family peptidase n=1 Tax=Methylocystis sp. H62 TaxID=2785789 RepID=UPI0018C327C1|nr:C39 family peptidase [Methylocystis sp. H62]MBG0791961.1 C39 family peptidase [Methylocystis sp. H62]
MQINRFSRYQAALRLPGAQEPEVGSAEVQAGAQEHIISGIKCVAQENRVWCACAAAKMILDFYGFEHTQAEIAIAMNTAPDGTPNTPNQVEAYKTLSQSNRIATYDDTPGFMEVQTEIAAGRPLKCGIKGHARTICGWKMDTTQGNEGSWLYIYDPWQAQIYWEKWGAVQILNYIFVRETPIG